MTRGERRQVRYLLRLVDLIIIVETSGFLRSNYEALHIFERLLPYLLLRWPIAGFLFAANRFFLLQIFRHVQLFCKEMGVVYSPRPGGVCAEANAFLRVPDLGLVC